MQVRGGRMTPRQRDLARYALGLPNKMRMSYRNRFVAGVGHDDYGDWAQMVAEGNAEMRDGKSLPYAGDSLFWLTESGARQVLNPREKLDPEDFIPANQGRLKNRLSDGPKLPRRFQ
jgi:hypothetical protein